AERAGLRHAARDVGKRDAAEKRIVGLAEDEERVGAVLTHLELIAADASPEGGARKVVGGPGGLPGRQELAALAPELRPGRIVGTARAAEEKAGARKGGRLVGRGDTQEGHVTRPPRGR